MFSVSCFNHIEVDNFCESVFDTYVLGHSKFSGMCALSLPYVGANMIIPDIG